MTIDAILLTGRRHAVVVLSGSVEGGCGTELTDSLRVAARSHTIVDLRNVSGVTPEMVKAILFALGQALDRGRTLRVVVRDEHQRRFLHSVGIGTMMPVHDSLADAIRAAATASPTAAVPSSASRG